MNRTELELRMKSLKKQQELTSEAMKDTQEQLDNLDAEENFKDTQKVLEKFLKFKGKIIVFQSGIWLSFMFKCKDIIPRKSKYTTPHLDFIAEGNIYKYDGTGGKECLKVCEGDTFSVGVTSDTYEKIQEMKDWNFWERRPTLKLIKAAQGINDLIVESGMDTTIDYDDKPVKQTK